MTFTLLSTDCTEESISKRKKKVITNSNILVFNLRKLFLIPTCNCNSCRKVDQALRLEALRNKTSLRTACTLHEKTPKTPTRSIQVPVL